MNLFSSPKRGLSVGEYHLLQPIFRHALDYGRIRIQARRYFPFQAASVAMSPNGQMFFPRQHLYCDDFSCVSLNLKRLFVHEATHVWQHQMGFPVRLCGLCIALQGGYVKARAYQIDEFLRQSSHFSAANMEQQAVLLEHFFASTQHNQTLNSHLNALMQDFLSNPANPDLLPKRLGI